MSDPPSVEEAREAAWSVVFTALSKVDIYSNEREWLNERIAEARAKDAAAVERRTLAKVREAVEGLFTWDRVTHAHFLAALSLLDG